MTRATHSNGLARHAIAVDVALFTIQAGTLKVLLVKRRRPPFRGTYALPGGMVGQDEAVSLGGQS